MIILLPTATQKSKFTHQSSGDLMVDGSGNLMKNYLKIIDERETQVSLFIAQFHLLHKSVNNRSSPLT